MASEIDTSTAVVEGRAAELDEQGDNGCAADAAMLRRLCNERDALVKRAEAGDLLAIAIETKLLRVPINQDDYDKVVDERDAAQAALREQEAEVGRLREALTGCHALLVTQKFSPDPGSPPMVKDGFWDRIVEQARAALATPAPEDAA